MSPQVSVQNPAQDFQTARELVQAGRWPQAAAIFGSLLAQYPGDPRLLLELGNVRLNMQDFRQAEQWLAASLAREPNQPYARLNLAIALQHLRRYPEALDNLRQALAIKPDLAAAHFESGCVLRQLGQTEAALQSFKQAIAHDPGLLAAHINLGVILQEQHRHHEALDCFQTALGVDPAHADLHYNQANSLMQLRRYPEALQAYQLSAALNPGSAKAHNGMAFAQTFLKQYRAAAESYRAALALQPEIEFLPGYQLRAQLQICDWRDIDAQTAAMAQRAAQKEKVCSPLAMLTLCDDPYLQRQTARLWTEAHYPRLKDLPPPRRARDGKIRVAYFSADFRTHPVALLSAGLFEHHDKNNYEITGVYLGLEQDAITLRLKNAFDVFIDASAISDTELAQICRDMHIDIAVTLGGHTADARLGVFARRAAPIQVSYLGYAGTLGAPFMDYLIADATVVNAANREFFDERIVYLPHSFMITDNTRPIDGDSIRRQDFGLPDAAMVYCCFNNSYKISPASFASWMNILRQVPSSVLWLSEHNPDAAANLQNAAAAFGVAPARLIFAKRLPDMTAHLARHRLADLFLDTLPYNAHASACDALWAGLPVLTQAGRGFAGRVAASVLHAAGLPELVTNTPDEYQALAINLAENRPRLAAVKQRLAASRLSSPLFDTECTTHAIEQAYLIMLQRQRQNLAPEDIIINAYQAANLKEYVNDM